LAASAASSAGNVESTIDDAATVAQPPSEAAVAGAGADPTAKTTGALDRLMEGRSLRNSKEPGDANGMPTIDRARFVQRVEGAMKAAHQRDGKIQVRLSPPELGSVKIEIAMQNGVLSAKLEAETPAARNLLLDSLPALRERLAQQDIRIEKFDVDVRQEGGNAGSGQTDDRTAGQSGEQQQNRPRTGGNRAPTTSTPIAARAIATAGSAATGLDVRV
jgi:flagellar hook-length control protein FliK